MRKDRAAREAMFPAFRKFSLPLVQPRGWGRIQESAGRSARTSVFPKPLVSNTAAMESQKTREISTYRGSFNRARDLPKECGGTGSLQACDICDVMRG